MTPPPRYVVLPRRSTVLLFGSASFNPTASLQVAQMGDVGMIDSLMGRGFYELLAAAGLQLRIPANVTDDSA